MLLTQLASRLRAQRAIFFPAASFAASGSSSLSLSAAAQAQGQHSAIRSALLRFLQRCFALVRGASVGDGTSAQPAGQATLALLECIELADVYVPAGPDAPIWLEELGSVAQRTLADLKSNPNSMSCFVLLSMQR